jgi:hypothetical protein
VTWDDATKFEVVQNSLSDLSKATGLNIRIQREEIFRRNSKTLGGCYGN